MEMHRSKVAIWLGTPQAPRSDSNDTVMHGTFKKRVTSNYHLDDYQQLARAAAAKGMPVAVYQKAAALRYTDKRFLVGKRLDELLDRFIAEARRIGSNVNQVAAKANSTGSAGRDDLHQVMATVAELESTIRILKTVLHNLSPER